MDRKKRHDKSKKILWPKLILVLPIAILQFILSRYRVAFSRRSSLSCLFESFDSAAAHADNALPIWFRISTKQTTPKNRSALSYVCFSDPSLPLNPEYLRPSFQSGQFGVGMKGAGLQIGYKRLKKHFFRRMIRPILIQALSVSLELFRAETDPQMHLGIRTKQAVV
jgi:hypothetical protein